jgi:hypothetical protein
MYLKFKLICLFSFSIGLGYLLMNYIESMPRLKLRMKKDFGLLDLIHKV